MSGAAAILSAAVLSAFATGVGDAWPDGREGFRLLPAEQFPGWGGPGRVIVPVDSPIAAAGPAPPRYEPYAGQWFAAPPATASGAAPEREAPPDDAASVAQTVAEFVGARAAAAGGDFLAREPGGLHRLRLLNPGLRRRVISHREAIACAVFKEVGTGREFDLDFYLEREGWEWKVARIVVHSVDGISFGSPPAGGAAPGGWVAPPVGRGVPRPQGPPRLTLRLAFREPSGNDVLDGGETGSLEVSIMNSGVGPAYATTLSAQIEGNVRGMAILGFTPKLGDIAPGHEVSKSIPLAAADASPTQRVRVKLQVREANGFDSEPVAVVFETRPYRAPRLELSDVALVGPGVLRPGQAATVGLRVRNAGTGPARGARIELRTGRDVFPAAESTVVLGDIRPGRSAEARFELFINRRYRGSALLPAGVVLFDGRGTGPEISLGLTVGASGRPPAAGPPDAFGAEGAQPAAPEDVDSPPKTPGARDPDAYAVVVGIENYRDLPAVEHARRDAEVLRAYLTQSMGFDPLNVVALLNERATLTDMAVFLGPWLEDRVTPKSRVFVYFAGHGSPEPASGDGYLVPYEGDPSYLQTKAYPLRSLIKTLSSLKAAEVTLVLDSCFSGAGGRSVVAKGARPLAVKSAAYGGGDRLVIVSAASGGQISIDYPQARHGLLTYFLLKGLRGGADSDKDGRVTTAEIFAYIKPNVERQARLRHVEQTPSLWPPGGRPAANAREWIRLR